MYNFYTSSTFLYLTHGQCTQKLCKTNDNYIIYTELLSWRSIYREIFHGNFSRRKNSPNSCYRVTISIDRTSVTHIDTK